MILYQFMILMKIELSIMQATSHYYPNSSINSLSNSITDLSHSISSILPITSSITIIAIITR